jgi:hypothetical protein
MRIWLTLGVCGVVFAGALVIQADESEVDRPPVQSFWMTQKLEASNEILVALATEDFDAMVDKAAKMKRLIRLESLARHDDSEEYKRQLRLFQRTVDMLAQEAEEEYLDGAALAYTHMALSCVNCHRHLRRVAHGDTPSKTAINGESQGN